MFINTHKLLVGVVHPHFLLSFCYEEWTLFSPLFACFKWDARNRFQPKIPGDCIENSLTLTGNDIASMARNLTWRYLPHTRPKNLRPKFQGISPQNESGPKNGANVAP